MRSELAALAAESRHPSPHIALRNWGRSGSCLAIALFQDGERRVNRNARAMARRAREGEGCSDTGCRIRQRWAALRDGRRGVARPRFPPVEGGLLFPYRAFGRRKDVAAEASLPCATSHARSDFVVRRGSNGSIA